MKRIVLALFAALLLQACVRELELDAPPTFPAGTRSLLWVLHPDKGQDYVYAVRVDDDGTALFPPLTLSRAQHYAFYLLLYDCDLTSLGLTPGEVKSGRAGQIEAPSAIFSAGFVGASLTSWLEVPVSDSNRLRMEVPALQLIGFDPCDTFTAGDRREFDFTNNTAARIALRIDREHALVGPITDDQQLAVLGKNTIVTASIAIGKEFVAGGFARDDGELWLLISNGELIHGTLGALTQSTARFTPDPWHDTIAAIDGPAVGPVDLYALLRSRSLAHWSRESWEDLKALGPLDDSASPPMSVAWLDHERAIGLYAVSGAGRVIVDHRGSQTSDPAATPYTAVARVPELYAVLGKSDGHLDAGDPPNLTAIDDYFPPSSPVTAIAPFAGGLAIGHDDGTLSLRTAAKLWCTPMETQIPSLGRIRRIAVLSDDDLVVVSGGAQENVSAWYLSRNPRACRGE